MTGQEIKGMSDFKSSPLRSPRTDIPGDSMVAMTFAVVGHLALAWGPIRLLFPGPQLVKGDMVVPAEKFHSKQRSSTNCNPDPE